MSDIDAVESLVLDKDFRELSRKSKLRPRPANTPNIFKILGIERREIYWSAFLAWLLDPSGNHGLGDRFLREFLAGMSNDTGDKKDRHVDMSHARIRVRKEERFEISSKEGRFDIVIEWMGKEKRLCIIENKVGSEEGLGQTGLYYEAGEKIQEREKYDDVKYVFLSPPCIRPSCEKFVHYSYEEIVDILKRISSTNIGM